MSRLDARAGAPSRRRTLGSAPDHLGASAPASRSHPHSWPLPQRCPSAGTPTRASRRPRRERAPDRDEVRVGRDQDRVPLRARERAERLDRRVRVEPFVQRCGVPVLRVVHRHLEVVLDRPVRDVLGEPRGAGPGATGRRSRPAAQRDRILGPKIRAATAGSISAIARIVPAAVTQRRPISGDRAWTCGTGIEPLRARTGARTGRRCPLPPTGPTSSSILGRSRAP